MTLDVAAIRARLEAERNRVAEALVLLDRDRSENLGTATGDNHAADPSVVAVDRELDSTLGENTEAVLAAIDAALARLADGSFGTCTRCGLQIGEARLEAMPHTELCIDCKRLAERR